MEQSRPEDGTLMSVFVPMQGTASWSVRLKLAYVVGTI